MLLKSTNLARHFIVEFVLDADYTTRLGAAHAERVSNISLSYHVRYLGSCWQNNLHVTVTTMEK